MQKPKGKVAAKKTNDFHDIRLRELRRERESLKGAPASQVAPSYFVPSLKEICASVIADHFEQLPDVHSLREVSEDLYNLVVDQLSTDLKLTVSVPRVKSQDYWRSCCEARWSVGQLTTFTKSGRLEPPERGGWKRVFLERNLEEYLMGLDSPTITDEEEAKLVQLCTLCGADIYSLRLDHQRCRIDIFESLFAKLPHLEELLLTYSVLNAAVTFKLDMIGFRQADALGMQRVLKSCPMLKSLRLPGNRIDSILLKAIVAGLVKNNTLTTLDLSHNKIDDEGAIALGVLLSKKDSSLQHVDLGDNQIRAEGAKALGAALGSNTAVTDFSLRLNRIGEEGGSQFFEKLKTNQAIVKLNVVSNGMGVESAKCIAEYLKATTVLQHIELSGNDMKDEGGKLLSEGVGQCASLRVIDVRNCGLSEQEMTNIDKVTRRRVQSLKVAETEKLEQEMRENIQKMVAEKVRKTHGM